MRILLTLSCLLSIFSTFAQNTSRPSQDTARRPLDSSRQIRDTSSHDQDSTRSPGIDMDKTFTKVEIEAAYPGGTSAWLRFLNKTFRYPVEAQEYNIQGDVMVQFIVDKEGNVSDIEAISGPIKGGLREEAVRVIGVSGKWVPAIQNGRQVRSYKKQKLSFKMVNG